jgi:hypothetical protein
MKQTERRITGLQWVEASPGEWQLTIVGGGGKSAPRAEPPVQEHYHSIEDTDVDACQQLMRAVLERMIHDSCGAVVISGSSGERYDLAIEAWLWLHEDMPSVVRDRHMTCELAGVDAGDFDRAIRAAAIPRPEPGVKGDPAMNLERTYWRLGGSVGPEPGVDKIERKVRRPDGKVDIVASYVPKSYAKNHKPTNPAEPRPKLRVEPVPKVLPLELVRQKFAAMRRQRAIAVKMKQLALFGDAVA